MKKKVWIAAIALFLAVLFVPIPKGQYKDGGTREYAALTYKIVDWNRLTADGAYQATKVYWFPDNFQSIDQLWSYEEPEVVHRFVATVLDLDSDSVLVKPVTGEDELRSSDRIQFGIQGLGDIGAKPGSKVEIYYTGGIMESYPAQIHAVKWELIDNPRNIFPELLENGIFEHIVITEIHSDYFLARTIVPSLYTIKVNGHLSADWCVGDQVACTYENIRYDEENNRAEAELLTIAASDWEAEPGLARKPVIYLYPEAETDVSVKLFLDGKLTCAYPAYHSGWQVTAAPDGTLTDAQGQTYNYLYWEGETAVQWDMSEGFCVRGEDTATFLEASLAKLGLNRKEANEFIVYWLSLMERNPYNIISFQAESYTDTAQLHIDPAPDTLIRVFMTWKAADTFLELPAQELSAPERTGFTVVEWGGTEVE